MSTPNSSAWPIPLKDWVQRCLGQATTLNKPQVHAELKKVIFDAYQSKTVWDIDWSQVQLESLKPPPPKGKRKAPSPAPDPGKRRALSPAPGSIKPSKMPKKSSIPNPATDSEDQRLKRARRFEREHEIERARQAGQGPQHTYSRHVNAKPDGGLADRMDLMASGSIGMSYQRRRVYGYQNADNAYDPNVLDWDQYTIVGRCRTLEKSYLRLTTEPDPETIRPLDVLERTLELLKRKWREEGNYSYICDQFKSLRQDLTVQRIKNKFTVSVYEIHARMALENKDLVEFNQCQSALTTLHSLGLEGHYEEFLAYRILYNIYTKARSELNFLISQLTTGQKVNPFIRHALDVEKALAMGNYHALFVLFTRAPNMGAYVMDFFLDRERVSALVTMCKAYKRLQLSFIASELAFENVSDAAKFLETNKAAFWEGMASTGTQPSGSWSRVQNIIEDKDKVLDPARAIGPLEQSKTKHSKVDIQGRI